MAPNPPTPIFASHWEQIPVALKERARWLVASLKPLPNGKPDKAPRSPYDGTCVSVAGPLVAATFDQAVARARSTGGGIGYALSREDDLFCIDIDPGWNAASERDREEKLAHANDVLAVFERAGAYVERSLRGEGWHIWGRTKQKLANNVIATPVEFYDHDHWIICTGNTQNALATLPDLTALYLECAEATRAGSVISQNADPDGEEHFTDDEVIDRMFASENAEKVQEYWTGGLGSMPSHSEADFALVGIIAFHAGGGSQSYPISIAQVSRIFRLSDRGSRVKAGRDKITDKYLASAVNNYRKRKKAISSIDLTALTISSSEEAISAPIAREVPKMASSDVRELKTSGSPLLAYPPGLAGEIAKYVERSSFIPSREGAIMAGLAMIAGIAGRTFETWTHLMLPLYLVFVAPSGAGKEDSRKGMGRLFRAMKMHCPEVGRFKGASRFASGQALRAMIAKKVCCVSVINEFGIELKKAWDPRSNDAWASEILDLYSAGADDEGKAYAKSENDIAAIDRPAFTLFGLTTAFKELLTEDRVRTGEIPRFIIREIKERGPDAGDTRDLTMDDALVLRLSQLANNVIAGIGNDAPVITVPCEPAAKAAYLELFRSLRKKYTPSSTPDVLVTRAAENALRVATLLALTENSGNPSHETKVCMHHWIWARDYVLSSVQPMIDSFNAGEVGSIEASRLSRIGSALSAYLAAPNDRVKELFDAVPKAHAVHVIQQRVLWRQVRGSFSDNATEFKRTLDGLISRGELEPLTDRKQRAELGLRGGDCYRINTEVM